MATSSHKFGLKTKCQKGKRWDKERERERKKDNKNGYGLKSMFEN